MRRGAGAWGAVVRSGGLLAIWLGVVVLAGAQEVDRDAAATLVVFNERDPESKALATFYAEKRGIPGEQIVGLNCPLTEEITRVDYDVTIAEPLREKMTAKGWWKLREAGSALGPVESNQIRFVALMRGMPLKIASAANYPGDRTNGPLPVGNRNDAAVDSELATLGFGAKLISGAVNNTYYRSFSRIYDARRPELMLVCRLDGPTADDVRRMILDGLAAEKEGLTGLACVDARGTKERGLTEGDKWLQEAALGLRKQGFPVLYDNTEEVFPPEYPLKSLAIYYGWYSEMVWGPFAQPGFKFERGAVAVHIHSFSGLTVRDPGKFWVGPLIKAGVAATLGNVYEPYLALTPHLDIFHDRLRLGFTFAEAAYMAQGALSWMTTFVGDPLYRPFKGAELGEVRPTEGPWADYRAGTKRWFQDRDKGAAQLQAAGQKHRSGMIFEGLGLLESSAGRSPQAIAAFQSAQKYYTQDEDLLRAGLHEVVQLSTAQRTLDCRKVAQRLITAHPQAPAAGLLRRFLPVATPSPR